MNLRTSVAKVTDDDTEIYSIEYPVYFFKEFIRFSKLVLCKIQKIMKFLKFMLEKSCNLFKAGLKKLFNQNNNIKNNLTKFNGYKLIIQFLESQGEEYILKLNPQKKVLKQLRCQLALNKFWTKNYHLTLNFMIKENYICCLIKIMGIWEKQV